MATDTKDPKLERINTLNKEIQGLVDHLMDLPEARLTKNSSLASSDAGLLNPKVIELIKNAVLKARRNTSATRNIADIKAIVAHIHHEAELEIRKIASEKPEKKEKKEEEGSHAAIEQKEKIEGTAVEKMVKAVENNKKAQIAAGNTSLAGGISEQQIKNNPLLAFKAEREKELKKGTSGKSPGRLKRFALKVKGIIRGGNSNRGRESKPEHQSFTQTPAMVQQNKAAVNTMLSSIERNKAAQQGKKPTTPNPQQLANNPLLAFKANLEKQTQKGQHGPKPVAEKPSQSAEEKIKGDKAKTAAPDLGAHKVLPAYELGNEGYEYGDIGFMDPLPSRGPGSEAIGNPNSELPYGYPASGDDDDDDDEEDENDQQQDDGGEGEGGGGNGGSSPNSRRGRAPSRNYKRGVPKLPSNPFGGGGGASAKLAQQGLMAFFRTPVGLAVLAVLIVLFLIIFLIFFWKSDEEETERATENAVQETLTIDKVKILPPLLQAKVGEKITFQIFVNDTKPAQEVTIIDYIPEGVSLLEPDVTSSWTKRVCDFTKKTCTYKASENGAPLNPPVFSFTVTYLVTLPFKEYFGGVEANAISSTSGSTNFTPASANNCNGKWNLNAWPNKNPTGKNYGDPACNFTKEELAKLVNQLDPQHLHEWVDVIAKEESANWQPNAYAGPQTGTPDARGAWGLFQMGSSYPAGQSPPAEGKNGPLDRGDVNWEIQTKNAIEYNKTKINGSFCYWSVAIRNNIAKNCK